ncbi:hypothetical protein B0T19DRAFT_253767 [Cercophora scortea]|uniref:Uncharacterized protein n=1 Tax=Cercophora scortea TaxID=314031 RepID=A0AAE0M723_9PEZI|nr:hypothetical protein B0T19DRAFT_253767 [Cercophora scortea]
MHARVSPEAYIYISVCVCVCVYVSFYHHWIMSLADQYTPRRTPPEASGRPPTHPSIHPSIHPSCVSIFPGRYDRHKYTAQRYVCIVLFDTDRPTDPSSIRQKKKKKAVYVMSFIHPSIPSAERSRDTNRQRNHYQNIACRARMREGGCPLLC